ncbi:RNA-dependent RNA polymerase [Leopards Hill virus]|uniref:RNA-directed RNA polymerase L n=1 Tax=Leopards Hill virus TaxID=1381104 RepID=A0A0B6VKX7_9VIRU|nr:RNA-dependent RNA polymerase [Leopards Hill virus]BAP90965.1 RNA-dependent RNA polymerase [Leopards Hill virus]
MEALGDLVWEELYEGSYSNVNKFQFNNFFDVDEMPGDGTCFFSSVSKYIFNTTELWQTVKSTCANYARAHWKEVMEMDRQYAEADAYISDLMRDQYWGGSIEAEILSKALNMTIYIWVSGDGVWVSNARRWGGEPIQTSLNLIHVHGGHFNLLLPKYLQPVQVREQMSYEEKVNVTVSAILDNEGSAETLAQELTENKSSFQDELNEELKAMAELKFSLFEKKHDIQLEKERAKPEKTTKSELDWRRKVQDKKNIPVRVGKVLNNLFNAPIEAVFDDGNLLLYPRIQGKLRPKAFSISALGHRILDGDKSFLNACTRLLVVVTSELMSFLDASYLLRLVAPGSGLSQIPGVVHPGIKVDMCLCVISILISSFLYKAKPKLKRNFINSANTGSSVDKQLLLKGLLKLNNRTLYNTPYKLVQEVSVPLFKESMDTIAEALRLMNAQSKVAFFCLDLNGMRRETYFNLLEELKTQDLEDKGFVSEELKELHSCVLLVVKLSKIADKRNVPDDVLEDVRQYLGSDGKIFRKNTTKKRNSSELAQECITVFFRRRMIFKFVSLRGKAYSGASVGNLIAYCHNLYLSRESLNFTEEDTEQLSIEIRKLNELLSTEPKKPIALICAELYKPFQELFAALPKDCSEECQTLFEDVRNSESHASAWSSALRIKGVAYEGFFSMSNGWRYIPEDLKPTLGMAIQTVFPEKFEKFLERTHLHPEYRDFTPDYLMCRSKVFKSDKVTKKVDSQGDPLVKKPNHAEADDDIQYAKLSSHRKRFPMPEIAVQEVSSVSAIMDRFKLKSSEKGRPIRQEESKPSASTEKGDIEIDELLIVEVGYQTDIEGKVVSDMEKWRGVINLMTHLGIKVNIITCADNSQTPRSDWWIEEKYVKLLLNSISYLFKELLSNSPSEITDIAVGNISTQKFRSVLKSGSIVKTPVTLKEVYDAWKVAKPHIMCRPTGTNLPEHIAEAIEVSLVEGAIMNRQSAEDVLSRIEKESGNIIKEFERTKNRHELNKNEVTAQKILFGWLMSDLNNACCHECMVDIKDNLNKIESHAEKLSYMCLMLKPNEKGCCRPSKKSLYEVSSFERRMPPLDHINHKELNIGVEEQKGTMLDAIVKLTLPGKTEKERKLKRSVEQLIRSMMRHSKVQAIKLPSGQMLVDSSFTTQATLDKEEGKSFKKGGTKTLLEDKEHFDKVLAPSKLMQYSEHVKSVIKHSIQRMDCCKGSLCEINPQWVKNVHYDLGSDVSDDNILAKIQESYEKKANFEVKNDKYRCIEWPAIEEYLHNKLNSHRLSDNKVFKLDCILFKEVYTELSVRLRETPYNSCPSLIASLLKLLLEFQWYQHHVLYSKICESFLQSCSEFHRAGIKVLRVRHTDVNLVVALPSNKKQNMRCVVYSKDFQLLQGPFMLNRRQAVLGAAYPYLITICFLQCLQHYRCLDQVQSSSEEVRAKIVRKVEMLGEVSLGLLKDVYHGAFMSASSNLLRLCKESGNFLNRSSPDHFISVFSGLTLVFDVLLGDSILNNSQPFNKQIQMMRFGMLSGLSRMSCPTELGKKFSSSCRKVEFHVSRLYMQLVVFACNHKVKSNLENWVKGDLCPEINMPCFSVFGTMINSDRQLIFDIYLVHIYNKELDDFDEGCIKVLEETAERHMSWETEVKEASKKIEAGQEARYYKRMLRLLLGVPNLKRMDITSSEGTESLSVSERGSTDSRLSNVSSKSARSFRSLRYRPTSIYGIRSSQDKPFSLNEVLEVSRDDQRDYQQAVTDRGMYHTYQANPESVYKDVVTCIRHNPNHTFASYELVQACTEIARVRFPPESIERARKDRKNWISISEVTETTSIVAEPRSVIMIKDAYQIILGAENKKIVKLLRGKFQRLGMECKAEMKGKTRCQELLTTIEILTDNQLDSIVKGITDPSKLTFYNWRDLVKMKIKDVLLTDDGNYIYCWLKSLAQAVKGSLRTEIKGLKYNTMGTKSNINKTKTLEDAEFTAVSSFINFLKACAAGEINSDLDNKEISLDSLLSSWLKFFRKVRNSKEVEGEGLSSLAKMAQDIKKMDLSYRTLCQLKKELPDLSFSREEIILRQLEKDFIKQHGDNILRLSNLIFLICLSCPWCVQYKTFESIMMRNVAEAPGFNLPKSSTSLRELHPDSIILMMIREACLDTSDEEAILCTKYCMCLFTVNEMPYTSAMNSHGDFVYKSPNEQLIGRVKGIMAATGLDDSRSDFKWTVCLIANSNFEVARKITGRSNGERLPRSVRSKVIYEIVKLVDSTEMAILQQLAFSYILDPNHRFFAVLAPKAQLGGHRDLLVQETGTKVIHAATEMFSRTLLSTTKDDGLTNNHLKETILNCGLEAINQFKIIHGKELSKGSGQYYFYRVCCISGDNTKWGPIHCCSIFSGMMQQLLRDYDDWTSFYKLTFLKNLFRQIEIPAASIKKILNSFRYKNKDIKVDQLTETELRDEMANRLQTWKGNDIMTFLVENYVSKGKMALNSYNHMGQGIHHATSSVLTSIMAEINERLIINFCGQRLPDLQVTVAHAGSSDDYAKCIVLSGVLTETLMENYEEAFWPTMCNLKNYLAGFNRACQMKDSAKTLVSDCFFEFYSEFMMSQRITPAVIKFILTGLINSSVTSPLSLVQACQVSSQQALFNSVPLITNIAFTIFRQQMFFNHTEYFSRVYGPITLGTLSPFGRLYVPKFSGLISSSLAIEDAEEVVKSCLEMKRLLLHLPDGTRAELDSASDDSTDKVIEADVSVESESVDTSSLSSAPTDSSGASFHFGIMRSLTSAEEEYSKVISQQFTGGVLDKVEEEMMLTYQDNQDYPIAPCISKLLKSGMVISNVHLKDLCDKPLRLIKIVTAVLNCLIAGHYRTFTSEGTEKSVKAHLNRDENRMIEDPMIQLLPEKLRRELNRLGLARMEADELIAKPDIKDTLSNLIANKLITMNCATEDYKSEVLRLKQTLTSRNVLHGLAGGIKELSLPLYTIFMKSYFFKDLVFLEHKDRWNSKHSTNYRDSTGKVLDGKVVVKYTTWLDCFLSSELSLNRSTPIVSDSLFDPGLKGIEVIHKSNGTFELQVLPEEIEVIESETRSLAIQFTDVNRQKIKVAESRPAKHELDAHKAVIVKSKLFSAIDQVKLVNNPAIVVGNLLDETSLFQTKPRIDMGNLGRDSFKLTQFYSSLVNLIREINNESETLRKEKIVPSAELVNRYANNLTVLCRMVQQARSKLTSFYMMKGSHVNNEPTVVELLNYGIVEGKFYEVQDEIADMSSYSVKYWKILQCVSAISVMPLKDNDKTALLTSFLNWKPSVNECDSDCPLSRREKSVLQEFNGRVLVDILSSELPSIKNEVQRKSIEDLVDFVNSPMELLRKKPCLGTTASFNCWDNGGKRGRFTYSSSTGDSSGVFIGPYLYIVLSNNSPALLLQVEKKVLEWLNKRRTDVMTREQHEYFLELLPDYRIFPKKVGDGKIFSLKPSREDPKLMCFLSPKNGDKVVKVKKNILSVKRKAADEPLGEPRAVWSNNNITILYDEQVEKTDYHQDLVAIKNLLDDVLGSDRSKVPSSVYEDTRIILSRIRFSADLFLKSLLLLHHFLAHTPSAAVLQAQSKTNLLKFIESSAVSNCQIGSLGKKIQKSVLSMIAEEVTGISSKEELICAKLTDALRKKNFSLEAWPEVQSYLDETGFSNIQLEFLQRGTTDTYDWKFKVIQEVSLSQRSQGVRGIISSISSEAIPRFLAPVIIDGILTHNIVQMFINCRNVISRTGISDTELDGLVCSIVFCSQSLPIVREGHRFSFNNLLHLATKKTFATADGSISCTFQNNGDEVQLAVKVRTVKPDELTESKKRRIELTKMRILTAYNSFLPPVTSVSEILSHVEGAYEDPVKNTGEYFNLDLGRKTSEGCRTRDLWELICPGTSWRRNDFESLMQIISLLSATKKAEVCEEVSVEDPRMFSAEQVTYLDLFEDSPSAEQGDSKVMEEPVGASFTFNWDD